MTRENIYTNRTAALKFIFARARQINAKRESYYYYQTIGDGDLRFSYDGAKLFFDTNFINKVSSRNEI